MPSLLRKLNNNDKKPMTLREFYENRNKVLIQRDVGGAGDILMHRQMFEDFKLIMPEAEIIFACPQAYHDLVLDHPFLSKIVDCRNEDYRKYVISYNTSSACGRYESAIAPLADKNRSDIWANHCGVELTRHDMHINLNNDSIEKAKYFKETLNPNPDVPSVLLCPVSAMKTKDLNEIQLKGLVDGLRARGCFVYASHHLPIPFLSEMGVPVIYGQRMLDWMAVINSADYVISVDTGAFHLAGGLKKPLMGIFTFADGFVYSQHYKAEIVQKHRKNGDWPCGPCYSWHNCPKTPGVPKPCLTEITITMLLNGVDAMLKKWPYKNH